MKKVKSIIFCFLFLFIFSSLHVCAKDVETFYSYFPREISELSSLEAKNVFLYNLKDDKVVYEKKSKEKISIASLTKLMTALVAIEKLDDLDQMVTIPSGAFHNTTGYATAGFSIGERVSVRDLLYGTLLPSGVEAAQALAITVSGSISSFVSLMNEKAASLGMQDTLYSNPVGRDDIFHYSTLQDVAKLLLYALSNDEFYKIYTSRNYVTTDGLNLTSTLVGPSLKYSLDVHSILGSKSGYTNDAGLCLSSIATLNGVSYLLITAGSKYQNGFPNHIVDSLQVYDYFSTYGYFPILEKDQKIVDLPIKDAFIPTYTIVSDEDVSFYLKEDMLSKLEYIYEGKEFLDYKVKENEKLGNVSVVYEGVELYQFPVYLKEQIKYKYTKFVIAIMMGILFLLCLFFYFKKRKKSNKKRDYDE